MQSRERSGRCGNKASCCKGLKRPYSKLGETGDVQTDKDYAFHSHQLLREYEQYG